MRALRIGVLTPLLLLCAAFGSWSLSSLCFLIAFFIFQYKCHRQDWRGHRHRPWKGLIFLAGTVLITEGAVGLTCAVLKLDKHILENQWMKILGFSRLDPWKLDLRAIFSLLPQLGVLLTALYASHQGQYISLYNCQHSLYDEEAIEMTLSLQRFVLPVVQLMAGVSRPSWVALPYFVCSCASLFHWSVTSNFIGLSWMWKPLLFYTGAHITVLYIYQVPFLLHSNVVDVVEYIGLFKVGVPYFPWTEAIQAVSLIALYILLCLVVNDMKDDQKESALSTLSLRANEESSSQSYVAHIGVKDSLNERLLPSTIPPPEDMRDLVRVAVNNASAYRASRKLALERKWMVTFQHATINFFTYGFPICMIGLICWSFMHLSLCAFGLLAYVGYVLIAPPSVITLLHLNPVLLGFILIWALSIYVFNAAFVLIMDKFDIGLDIWHTIGLWHYSTPGLFIFALFALGVLVATEIVVSNSIFKSRSEVGSPSTSGNQREEDGENKKVLVLAVIAWCVQRCSHIVSLLLIFIVGMKAGLLYAVYMGLFIVYLVSSSMAKRTRCLLILLCELHFAVLYLLQLDYISSAIAKHEASLKPILFVLGLWEGSKLQDFLKIGALLLFSAVQNHGLKVLSVLSAMVQQSPQVPLGWGILRRGNGGSILMSIYATEGLDHSEQESSTQSNWVTSNLAAFAENIQLVYRMFGTYIAFGTVLLVIYGVDQSYVSIGYLSLLLFWIVGRQLVGKSEMYLWLPLMISAGAVLIGRYILSAFPVIQSKVHVWIPLDQGFGFRPEASMFQNLWDCLAILIVMQLFRVERAQKEFMTEDYEPAGDYINPNLGYVGFIKRFLILHSGKVLAISVFYAAITPVSAVGLLYLVMLVASCCMPKAWRLPGQLYVLYTALLMASEYIFQMWGQQEQMLVGQTHGEFMFWLGLRFYGGDFWSNEAGMRSKSVVLIACILHCTTLGWLDLLPASLRIDERYEEPCLLFLPYPHHSHHSAHMPMNPNSSVLTPDSSSLGTKVHFVQQNSKSLCSRDHIVNSTSTPILPSETRVPSSEDIMVLQEDIASRTDSGAAQPVAPCMPLHAAAEVGSSSQSSRRSWGSGSESHWWRKKAVLLSKQDRYEAQLCTLHFFVKHTIENFGQLYGLELSMLVLLVGSFVLLNVMSLLYVFILALCICLSRRILRMLWPFFVVLFALLMVMEYVVLCKMPPAWAVSDPLLEQGYGVQCQQCWNNYSGHISYCWWCWLGMAVDDQQMLVVHFVVFMMACVQLRANMSAGGSDACSINTRMNLSSYRLAWKEISYETTAQWTWLDHIRFFAYRNLLHVVLLLIFVTGTLQYDMLHLGYLAFSLIFFRMRDTIMERRNSIFRFLRLYNFILIVASLAYQAPSFRYSVGQACTFPSGLYNILGFYKYDYGLHITERSALVDITIFCLVGLQSHIFRSREFVQVLQYLEAQQVEARARAQEDKAAWKKQQLRHIREMEEHKQQRRQQVEKMKCDMLHMQLRLEALNSIGPMIEAEDRLGPIYPSASPFSCPEPERPNFSGDSPRSVERIASEIAAARKPDGRVMRGLSFETHSAVTLAPVSSHPYAGHSDASDEEYNLLQRRKNAQGTKKVFATDDSCLKERIGKHKEQRNEKLRKAVTDSVIINRAVSILYPEGDSKCPTVCSCESDQHRHGSLKEGLMAGVQFVESGVTQVQSIGEKALSNFVEFLSDQEGDGTEASSIEEELRQEKERNWEEENMGYRLPPRVIVGDNWYFSGMNKVWSQMCMVCYYAWCKMRGNTNVVCYFFFLVVYVWNFSLLTLAFPATLFIYALIVNPGPSQHFWLVMLIYTELNILLQYCYQIYLRHCDPSDLAPWMRKLGIPGSLMDRSFVISVLPLFLVYLATLVQSSIKACDGEWMLVSESSSFASGRRMSDPEKQNEARRRLSLLQRLWKCVTWVSEFFLRLNRGLLRYWHALTHGSESPPHFVQLSMDVGVWPDAGIQPERIESGCNRLLAASRFSTDDCAVPTHKDLCSRVQVESIETSPDKQGTALAVLEVIYAAPLHKSSVTVNYASMSPAADVAAELQKAKEEGYVEVTGFPYPIISVIPGGKCEVDLYAYIFGTDLVTFLFVALFYQSFAKHSSGLLDVTQVEDQFPKDFVFVLMTLFFMIIIDRVLYLSSFATGKLVSYFLSLGLYTAYVTQVIWGMESIIDPTKSKIYFFQLLLLRIFYLMKGLSLALQASQIKYGLPHKSALYGQFLARQVNTFSWIAFRLYRALPFLLELRCVLDWACTTTALTMYDWLKLEDIYGSLFLVACDIKLVRERHRLGQKQGISVKFCSGVLLFSVLIVVIWAPMLIYSSGNPTNMANPVNDVRAGIQVKTGGGKFTLYETGLCHIHDLDTYPLNRSRSLSSYAIRDVQMICCEPDAATLWLIPPRTLQSLIHSIDIDDFSFISWWEFTRERPKGKEVTRWMNSVVNAENSIIGSQLKAVLNGTSDYVNIPDLYPEFFRVPGSGEVHSLEDEPEHSISGKLTLNTDGNQAWWSFLRDGAAKGDGCNSVLGPMAVTVSEEVPPKGLIGETLSKVSIWSLYITFVLAVGRFIRLQCSDIRMRIPYENFPTCDRLMAICEDIYAARAEGELELEEGLFWTLIKIYRAPYMLMEYTKVE